MEHILKMNVVLHEKIWGGTALAQYGYELPSDHTGEAWVISAHPHGDCTIANGEYKGWTLSELFAAHRELFGNVEGDEFPLLIKIIDANDNLSVQVHPDDAYAKVHENSLGKNECWYVLDAKEGTKMVMGHHAKTQEELDRDIDEDKYDDLLNVIDINKGDFFDIPAGTLHAICSGSLIYEAQQSSDITYRVYDYHRKDANGNERELHVQQAKDCIKVPANNERNQLFVNKKIEYGTCTTYLKNQYMTVMKFTVHGHGMIHFDAPFALVTVTEGSLILNDMEFRKGDNFVICSDVDELDYDGDFEAMVTTL